MIRDRRYRQEEVEGYAKQYHYNILTYGEEVPFSRIMVLNQVLGKEIPRNTSIIFVLIELDRFGNRYECIYSNEPITKFYKPDKNQQKLFEK